MITADIIKERILRKQSLFDRMQQLVDSFNGKYITFYYTRGKIAIYCCKAGHTEHRSLFGEQLFSNLL